MNVLKFLFRLDTLCYIFGNAIKTRRFPLQILTECQLPANPSNFALACDDSKFKDARFNIFLFDKRKVALNTRAVFRMNNFHPQIGIVDKIIRFISSYRFNIWRNENSKRTLEGDAEYNCRNRLNNHSHLLVAFAALLFSKNSFKHRRNGIGNAEKFIKI